MDGGRRERAESNEKGREWEAICRRCGQCCFEKWMDEEGQVQVSTISCRYLDIVTRRCKVYHKRFEVGEGCIRLTPEVVTAVDWLPPDCAYVEHCELADEDC